VAMAALNISKKQVCRLCYSWFHRHNLSFQRHERQPTHGDVDARIYGHLGCAPTAVFITIDPVDNWRRKRSSSRTATVRCSYHYLDRYAYILPIGSMFLAHAVIKRFESFVSLQHLAVRLPHHVSWVHNGCSEDPRAGNGGRHERARPKSEAAWCNVIASRCRCTAPSLMPSPFGVTPDFWPGVGWSPAKA
jgi:hypothetical protein